jgi:hypothetical protein
MENNSRNNNVPLSRFCLSSGSSSQEDQPTKANNSNKFHACEMGHSNECPLFFLFYAFPNSGRTGSADETNSKSG